eukprot:scaffold314550_cov36-Tisochrysis_lutea.AAC.1
MSTGYRFCLLILGKSRLASLVSGYECAPLFIWRSSCTALCRSERMRTSKSTMSNSSSSTSGSSGMWMVMPRSMSTRLDLSARDKPTLLLPLTRAPLIEGGSPPPPPPKPLPPHHPPAPPAYAHTQRGRPLSPEVAEARSDSPSLLVLRQSFFVVLVVQNVQKC